MRKNVLLYLLLLPALTCFAGELDKAESSHAILHCEDPDQCQHPIEHISTESSANELSQCITRCAKTFPADIRDLFDTNFETCKSSCLKLHKPSI